MLELKIEGGGKSGKKLAMELKKSEKENEATIKCEKCGSLTSRDGNYCEQCGERLAEEYQIREVTVEIPRPSGDKAESRTERPLKSQDEIVAEKLNDLDSKEKIEKKEKIAKVMEKIRNAISDIDSYLDDKDVSKELTKKDKMFLKESFKKRLSELTEEEEINEAISEQIDEINKYINERRRKIEKLKMEEEIRKIKGRDDIIEFLGSIDGIQGSKEFIKSETLKRIVTKVIDSGDSAQLQKIPRTAGFRDKIGEIMLLEKIRKE